MNDRFLIHQNRTSLEAVSVKSKITSKILVETVQSENRKNKCETPKVETRRMDK